MFLKNHSIKKDFLLIVIFSSFVPFLISLALLWFILKDSIHKIDNVRAQIQHIHELEILDSLHKSMAVVYEVAASGELSLFFSATNDRLDISGKNLRTYLTMVNKKIPFENLSWFILGSHKNILFKTPLQSNEYQGLRLSEHIGEGAYLNNRTNFLTLTLPLTTAEMGTKTTYSYIVLLIPINSIRKIHKYLKNIVYLPSDLSALKFKADFFIENNNNNFLYIFYAYAFVFILINFIAVYFGIHLFQEKIINKINLMSLRIIDEVKNFSKKSSSNFLEKEFSENEIDSLSYSLNKYTKYIDYLQYEVEKASKLAAVGNIAQNIAHDLKKPFSNINIFVEQIEKLNDIEKIKLAVLEYKPYMYSNIKYVQHLLKEITEANVTKLYSSDRVSFHSIVEKAFSQISFPIKIEAPSISIDYSVELSHFLKVDEQRVVRVFINIIQNAIEAMKGIGKIWIYANEDLKTQFAKIVIGNDNSYIEQENIQKLFEPFFTRNKLNGTGLGLSIAQRIVELHGGTISCQSEEKKGVEFLITLPLGCDGYRHENIPLSFLRFDEILREGLFKGAFGAEFSLNSINSNKQVKSENKIIVIDDDPFVCRSWQRTTQDANVLVFYDLRFFLNKYNENKNLLSERTILVSDFNFGLTSELDFYGFIKEIRKYFAGLIFLSSDLDDLAVNQDFLNNYQIKKIKKQIFSYSQLIDQNM